MSENINFIPANELPVAEGDEVSVLCIENGELKLKPVAKADDNSKYDMVLRLVLNFNSDEEYTYLENYEIVSGSFDAVVQKLDAGIIPVCLVIESGVIWDNREYKGVGEYNPCWFKSPDEMAFIYVYGADYGYIVYEDGTVEMD